MKHLQRFFSSDASGGIILIFAAALAMLSRQGKFSRDEGLAMLEAWAEHRRIQADFAGMWARLLV